MASVLNFEGLTPLPPITTTSICVRSYQDEEIKWIPRKTCYVSTAKQCGKVWGRLRLGAITMSMISYCLDRVHPNFRMSKEEVANIICGLSVKSFSDASLYAMQIGIAGEPGFRKWHSDKIGVPIHEVGVGVWKHDPRFRGSMDGELDDGTFAEYKLPERMYRALIEYVEATKKGFTTPPSDYSHIFSSHYDQMTGNGVIHDKTACHFKVAAWGSNLLYEQTIPVDHEHWNRILYPQGVVFHETYVEPLMRKYKFQRLDPVPIYSVTPLN